MSRQDFDNDIDGLAKFLMSGPDTARRRYPEPPPPRCYECDEEILIDDYDNPMPMYCRPCDEEEEGA